MLLGAAIVLLARPILTRLDVDLRPPALVYVAVAALLLGAIAMAGLCAPLWRLRRLDVTRTLSSE
jgi:ABC-type lipoprotein release transport system permease subunit